MNGYQIKSGEIIVLRDDFSDYYPMEGGYFSGELMLTTEAIVFTKIKPLPREIIGYDVFPLKDIQMYNGAPQVKCDSSLGNNFLHIYMNNGTILKYGLGAWHKKSTTLKWVDAIYELATGNTFTENDKSLRTRLINMAFKRENNEQVVKTCKSCGAPIKGVKGQFSQCEYCGSGMKL